MHIGDTYHSASPPTPEQLLHQLRAPVGDFVGRADEVDHLTQTLQQRADTGTAAIGIVYGMGGMGKTELSYAVAQRLAPAFPGALLFIELRGASSNSLAPAQALQTVIHAFAPEVQLPDTLGELQTHYRSLLNGKRVFIMADDAHDAAQVHPLMPPVGCALLITSRNHFTLPGATVLDLRKLRPAEAEQLLRTICPRIDRAAADLARLCGYLPLALRISASLLASDDTRPVARYLAQLKPARLTHLRDPDDPQASVEASLQLSYDALPRATQQTLAQMSVFPISFDLAAAVAVVDSTEAVEDTLSLLRRRSLLEWDTTTARYSLHDLVQEFAAAQLANEDLAPLQLRHAQHYAVVAAYAENELYLKGQALAGLALFDQERAHIDAGWTWAQTQAGNQDIDALITQLAGRFNNIATLRYDFRRDFIPRLDAGRQAARRLGHRQAEGVALNNLGLAYAALGQLPKALEY